MIQQKDSANEFSDLVLGAPVVVSHYQNVNVGLSENSLSIVASESLGDPILSAATCHRPLVANHKIGTLVKLSETAEDTNEEGQSRSLSIFA